MDPLDWTHQWDDYEMMMYVCDDPDEEGIRMQVSRRQHRDGAEEWELLYDRKLADLPSRPPQTEHPKEREDWEESLLRTHLHEHPHLVDEEKRYLAEWRRQRSDEEPTDGGER
ncbi:hypothetical protein [Alicyclobacillus shizuokensis]|uniref:hypothetical protein n=1 Tax=Alicyclobacillus shizuokensis TaxID=392014 RepID=UPI00082F1B29|nr:hypothetical protein [Alicyclobacillus shizuokensis]MCL6625150.1 hypothetical protein [Alicyclobacillus shizuokensis]